MREQQNEFILLLFHLFIVGPESFIIKIHLQILDIFCLTFGGALHIWQRASIF